MLNNHNLISSIQFNVNEPILTSHLHCSFTSHFVMNKNGKEYGIYIIQFTIYAPKQVNLLQNNGVRFNKTPNATNTFARFANED